MAADGSWHPRSFFGDAVAEGAEVGRGEGGGGRRQATGDRQRGRRQGKKMTDGGEGACAIRESVQYVWTEKRTFARVGIRHTNAQYGQFFLFFLLFRYLLCIFCFFLPVLLSFLFFSPRGVRRGEGGGRANTFLSRVEVWTARPEGTDVDGEQRGKRSLAEP